MKVYNSSRLLNGLTQSRYPSRVRQVIPPFSLWWIGMVYDYCLWRNDVPFIKSLMPGVRAVVDYFLGCLNSDDLLEAPNGWNFVDWVPGWDWGCAPDSQWGVSGVLNWHLALALTYVAALEDTVNEPELANRARRLASELSKRTQETFWDQKRGLFADDITKKNFSEHSQCLAILSRQLPEEVEEVAARNLVHGADLKRATIYFSHYLFESYRMLGRVDQLFDRMGLWFSLKELGFKTTLESPEPSRSDCHAWGAHPIYHFFTSVLGIRPGLPGFQAVEIDPQLNHLKNAKGVLAHPKGDITVDFKVSTGRLRGKIILPPGISGLLTYLGQAQDLEPGEQDIDLGA